MNEPTDWKARAKNAEAMDSVKTREINVLVKENRELLADLDRLKATSVEREKVLVFVEALRQIGRLRFQSSSFEERLEEAIAHALLGLNHARALGLLEDGK